MWWFLWFWPLYILSFLKSSWLALKDTLWFWVGVICSSCTSVRPPSWLIMRWSAGCQRQQSENKEDRFSARLLRCKHPARRSVCRTLGSSAEHHPTVHWMLGCARVENVCVRIYTVFCGSLSLALLLELPINSVIRNKVLKLCLLVYLCDPDHHFENRKYRVVRTFFRQFHLSVSNVLALGTPESLVFMAMMPQALNTWIQGYSDNHLLHMLLGSAG